VISTERWRVAIQIANVIGAIALAAFWVDRGLLHPHLTADGAAYWSVRDGVLYELPWLAELAGEPTPYVYSPATAQLLWPLAQLPLSAFMAVWVGLQLVLLAWLASPAAAALLVFFVPAIGAANVWAGSIGIVLTAALAWSLRFPALWAVQLLTKVTLGVGILWHVARREWRSTALALGTTALIVAVSFVSWPAAWVDWFELLTGSAALSGGPGTVPIPVLYRLPVAAAIVVLGALRGWTWLLPVGVILAAPQIGLSTLVFLLAIPRLMLDPRTSARAPVEPVEAPVTFVSARPET
jgi:hypothetical protein